MIYEPTTFSRSTFTRRPALAGLVCGGRRKAGMGDILTEAGCLVRERVRSRPRNYSWAELLHRVFEVDPLLCVCGAEMKIVSIITDPRVVDRILRHLESQACRARDPFEPRAPLRAGGNSLP